MTRSIHRIPPPPAPGAGIVRLGAAGRLYQSETIRGTELCGYFDLGGDRLRQHPRTSRCTRRARQRDIGEFFVLERQFDALDLFMRARTLQALGEVAPVRRGERTLAVMRAG